MRKWTKSLITVGINFCLLIALGIDGTGTSLLFFGEPKYPTED